MITVEALRKSLEGLDDNLELDITPDTMTDDILLYYPDEVDDGGINIVARI